MSGGTDKRWCDNCGNFDCAAIQPDAPREALVTCRDGAIYRRALRRVQP